MQIDGFVSRSVFLLDCELTDGVLHAVLVFQKPGEVLAAGQSITLWEADKGRSGLQVLTQWPDGMPDKLIGDVEFEILELIDNAKESDSALAISR
jgi:hypothetical protein